MIFPSYKYNAKVVRIVDGDTGIFLISCGFDIFHEVRLRLLDVNTPELRGEDKVAGQTAKEILKELLPAGTKVVIETSVTDKYGRYVAQIYRTSDSADINELMRTTAPVGGF